MSYKPYKPTNLEQCKSIKKVFSKWAIEYEGSWLSSQMAKLIANTSCSNLDNCKHHKKITNGSIHYYTSLVSYIAYDRFLGRNHGASSLLNGIVGSVFTVNGGISRNL